MTKAFKWILALLLMGGVVAILLVPWRGGRSPVREPVLLVGEGWSAYQRRFITPEGRVCDDGNGCISHSEGQGYALVLATAFDDRQTFDLVWQWTRATLQRPDGLFSWRYVPSASGVGGSVPDPNTATDGDILIAWALARGGARWNDPSLTREARRIAESILAKSARMSAFGEVLLPGPTGFEKEGTLVLNLSYWIWPAFPVLERLTGDRRWSEISNTGIELLKVARFGTYKLPPDWIAVTAKNVGLAPGYKNTYGYDAVRIPLYLIWGKRETPDLLEPFRKFWASFADDGTTPATVDLETGAVSKEPWLEGARAIAKVVSEEREQWRSAVEAIPFPEGENPYYSATLFLLTKLAVVEAGQ